MVGWPHGGHFISNAERKEASHPVSREYARIQSVMEGDVRELDIQCLPTTPTPRWLFFFPCAHSSSASMHRDALLPFAAGRQEAAPRFFFPAPSVAVIPTGLTAHKQRNGKMCFKLFILWKECLFWQFRMTFPCCAARSQVVHLPLMENNFCCCFTPPWSLDSTVNAALRRRNWSFLFCLSLTLHNVVHMIHSSASCITIYQLVAGWHLPTSLTDTSNDQTTLSYL